MRISIKTLLALVTIASLVCIVSVQNHRSTKTIATLESNLRTQEIKLSRIVLVFNAFASAPVTSDSNELAIAEVLFILLTDGDLLIKHGNKIAETANMYRGYDPDPAVRARQLMTKIEVNEEFIAQRVAELIQRANVEILEYVIIAMQSDPRFEFKKSDRSARRQKFDTSIESLRSAIKEKTSSKIGIAG